MKKIAYTRADGGVSIVCPLPKSEVEVVLGAMTDSEHDEHVWATSVPVNAVDAVYIENAAIPADREFRAAFKLNGKSIAFDLVKAKELQLEKIRQARAPKLLALDTDFMLALENGDEAKKLEVVSAKQALRDITEPLKALVPTSIEDVKMAFPQELM